MAQINLLGSDSKGTSGVMTSLPIFLVRALVVIFIGLLVYWGVLFVQAKLVKNEISSIQQEIISVQNEILKNEDRKALLAKQGQIEATKGLISEHEYWSKLLPELARITLGSARYLSFTATGEGTARMVVNVPNYQEMDLFLQVFNRDEFNNKFSSVSVSGVSKVQQGDVTFVRFEVAVKYNPDFLLKSEAEKENLSVLR